MNGGQRHITNPPQVRACTINPPHTLTKRHRFGSSLLNRLCGRELLLQTKPHDVSCSIHTEPHASSTPYPLVATHVHRVWLVLALVWDTAHANHQVHILRVVKQLCWLAGGGVSLVLQQGSHGALDGATIEAGIGRR